MASVMSLLEKDLCCPVCRDIYDFPVTLECGHTTCKICVQQHWEWKGSRECPICHRQCFTDKPPINLALKIASDSLRGLKLQEAKPNQEAQCNLHNEQLKVFCLVEEKPICTVCQVSWEHKQHLCCPVEEAALDRKREISTQLSSFQKQLRAFNVIKEDWTQTENYIKFQADKTEGQMKMEFEKLHKFLWDEETTRLAALREEEKKKIETVREKLESITNTIAVLSGTIGLLQDAMEADDVSFLQDFKQTKSRALTRTPEVERISGALIDVPKYLGSLKFHVWEKMLEIINYAPVAMDPNTAHPNLTFTLELSSVRYSSKHQMPDNPERCSSRVAVLGAAGFTSGRQAWEVEVGDNRDWSIGVAQESIRRKESIFLNPGEGFWTISLCNGDTYWAQTSPRTRLSLKTKPQRITVDLDYDRGRVVFLDAAGAAPIYTFKQKFSEKVFPYFSPGINVEGKNEKPIRVSPLTVSVLRK